MFENTVHVTDISSQRFQGWFGHCAAWREPQNYANSPIKMFWKETKDFTDGRLYIYRRDIK